jgi:hypothetical protein
MLNIAVIFNLSNAALTSAVLCTYRLSMKIANAPPLNLVEIYSRNPMNSVALIELG